jgi:hypothetical protein
MPNVLLGHRGGRVSKLTLGRFHALLFFLVRPAFARRWRNWNPRISAANSGCCSAAFPRSVDGIAELSVALRYQLHARDLLCRVSRQDEFDYDLQLALDHHA